MVIKIPIALPVYNPKQRSWYIDIREGSLLKFAFLHPLEFYYTLVEPALNIDTLDPKHFPRKREKYLRAREHAEELVNQNPDLRARIIELYLKTNYFKSEEKCGREEHRIVNRSVIPKDVCNNPATFIAVYFTRDGAEISTSNVFCSYECYIKGGEDKEASYIPLSMIEIHSQFPVGINKRERYHLTQIVMKAMGIESELEYKAGSPFLKFDEQEVEERLKELDYRFGDKEEKEKIEQYLKQIRENTDPAIALWELRSIISNFSKEQKKLITPPNKTKNEPRLEQLTLF